MSTFAMKRQLTILATAVLPASALLLGLTWPAVGQAPSAAGSSAFDQASGTEELIRIPRAGTNGGMLTRICRAAGGGPAPLVVINHGSPPIASNRAKRKPSSCGEAARFFTTRGYVVAFPLRRGYGETGGKWAEAYGKCDNADYVKGGDATADDIEAAIAHVESLAFVAKGKTIVIGQSAGGWGTLAFARRNPTGVRTYINFAGGRGAKFEEPGRYSNCSPDALVAAAAVLAKSSPPSLWIYTENDLLNPPALSRRLHAAYNDAGGRAEYVLLPPYSNNGHNLLFGKGGSAIWGPVVDRWLSQTKGSGG